ncbi:MAG: 2-C-methyl-D-erythritol 4-phosphate cytidylyltransferase [Kangiellaceae bacterium]|nr:2-C-methyl-D-erythritol 4-phosphate cytidylyltransferase [Kangiellaceae bacterium]|tara:strand:+ start:5108 stop:5818 length:711 start_codon:yes stop_codon:yes gene_type:complete
MKESYPNIHVILPAAGSGKRMGMTTPKQYLQIGDKCILQWSIEAICEYPSVASFSIAIGKNDKHWVNVAPLIKQKTDVFFGGEERANSVLNGLRYLEGKVREDDWIMVHDAARPCVAMDDIKQLMLAIDTHEVGGLLTAPVSDTIKKVKGTKITGTLDREKLRRALTPQVFRYGILRQAIEVCFEKGIDITDESSAIEQAGYKPAYYDGSSDNFKLTHAEDLSLIEAILMKQGRLV